jgi:hypothetical protein
MCVIAVKYFKDAGWVGAKNRDRNYLPEISIVQSNRRGVQRLFIDDELTRYTEGLNEYGVSILSAALAVKNDEKEADKVSPGQRDDDFMSPDGKAIRKALLERTPKKAVDSLIASQLAGATIIFNEKECWLIESGYNIRKDQVDENNPRKYIFKKQRLENKVGNFIVRTNHGELIPELGYQPGNDDPEKDLARESSEKRREYAFKAVAKCKDPAEMMNTIAIKEADKNAFFNPVRVGDPGKEDMVTTGQLMLVPSEKTMHYRPLYSSIEVKYSTLNGPKAKTFFEIISSRDLITFKEAILWQQKRKHFSLME